MADTYFYETVANVPFDGGNGSTLYTDYSFQNRPFVNVNAGPALTTANPKFAGTASLLLNGSSGQVVVRNDTINTGVFGTIEMHFRFSSLTAGQGIFEIIGASGSQVYVEKAPGGVLNAGTFTSAVGPTSKTVVASTWYHLAASCDAASARIYVDGILVLTMSATAVFNNVSQMILGATGNYNGMSGQIANLRVTPGIARYTANFTPPTAPYDITQLSTNAFALAPVMFYTIPAGVMPAVHGVYVQQAIKIADFVYGGTGMISGTTAIKSLPDNTLVSRKVRLYNERDGNLIAEQWSDAVTGAYTFNNLSMTLNYTVIAYDTPHNFRAVVADNLTPDPMP